MYKSEHTTDHNICKTHFGAAITTRGKENTESIYCGCWRWGGVGEGRGGEGEGGASRGEHKGTIGAEWERENKGGEGG